MYIHRRGLIDSAVTARGSRKVEWEQARDRWKGRAKKRARNERSASEAENERRTQPRTKMRMRIECVCAEGHPGYAWESDGNAMGIGIW